MTWKDDILEVVSMVVIWWIVDFCFDHNDKAALVGLNIFLFRFT